MFEFEIKNETRKARTGLLNMPHGKIETPNLAIVATHGHVKLLTKTDEKRAGLDLTISNAFHLFVNRKVSEIKKAGGIHKWTGLKNPVMTDSGGFQVFSLGWGKVYGVGKVGFSDRTGRLPAPAADSGLGSRPADRAHKLLCARTKLGRAPRHSARKTDLALSKVVISENGVIFDFDGKKYELTPEKSVKIQQDIGADIIFAFDECTSPLHSHNYTKKAMERTHRWANRCLSATQSRKNKRQALFGIVQGGIFEDLRKKSSRIIGSLGFDGFGIGGSFGEKQMKKVLRWSLSGLSEEKPRHLLGIGKIDDIFIAVRQGIDLFDCVVPTREARHGILYTKAGKLNIKKEVFRKDGKMIERGCNCWVCQQGIRRNDVHERFKTEKIIGQRFATIHNILFFKNLFTEIREAISKNKLDKLEEEYYNYF